MDVCQTVRLSMANYFIVIIASSQQYSMAKWMNINFIRLHSIPTKMMNILTKLLHKNLKEFKQLLSIENR